MEGLRPPVAKQQNQQSLIFEFKQPSMKENRLALGNWHLGVCNSGSFFNWNRQSCTRCPVWTSKILRHTLVETLHTSADTSSRASWEFFTIFSNGVYLRHSRFLRCFLFFNLIFLLQASVPRHPYRLSYVQCRPDFPQCESCPPLCRQCRWDCWLPATGWDHPSSVHLHKAYIVRMLRCVQYLQYSTYRSC